MREIDASVITKEIAKLCVKANLTLPNDIKAALKSAYDKEVSPASKNALFDMCRNVDIAVKNELPVCQDTGIAVVFAEIGQDCLIVGDLRDAINEGVRIGYRDGFLRKSIVKDPLNRINTEDNTPAIIHFDIVSGDKIKLTVAPKGFGSENMSAIKMFNPSATKEDIINFVLQSVLNAGSNPCPPVVVGVGIGGNFEYSAFLSKKALTRNIEKRNENPYYSDMEEKILDLLNKTGIGAQGFGGTQSALAVNIEVYPTHIAGLPVAVNMGCHITRHESVII